MAMCLPAETRDTHKSGAEARACSQVSVPSDQHNSQGYYDADLELTNPRNFKHKRHGPSKIRSVDPRGNWVPQVFPPPGNPDATDVAPEDHTWSLSCDGEWQVRSRCPDFLTQSLSSLAALHVSADLARPHARTRCAVAAASARCRASYGSIHSQSRQGAKPKPAMLTPRAALKTGLPCRRSTPDTPNTLPKTSTQLWRRAVCI